MTVDETGFQAYTGLSERQLATVGFITLVWNQLETGLSALILELAGWPGETGKLVTTDMPNLPKIELFKNLVNLVVGDKQLNEECEDLVAFFDDLRIRRNKLVHSVIIYSPSLEDPPRLIKRSGRSGKGRISQTAVESDVVALGRLAADLQLCATAMRPLFTKIWRLRFYKKNHKASDPTTAADFIHAAEASFVEIEKMRGRWAELHPKRAGTHPQEGQAEV